MQHAAAAPLFAFPAPTQVHSSSRGRCELRRAWATPHVGEGRFAALLDVAEVEQHGCHPRGVDVQAIKVAAVLLPYAVPQHLHVLLVRDVQLGPRRDAVLHAGHDVVLQARDEGAVARAHAVQHAVAVGAHHGGLLHLQARARKGRGGQRARSGGGGDVCAAGGGAALAFRRRRRCSQTAWPAPRCDRSPPRS